MKKLFLALLLLATVARAETYRWTDSAGTVHFADSPDNIPAAQRSSAKTSEAADNKSASPQVNQLQERMQQDDGIMTLILALQSDPEMQALLADPAIISAVQAGDVAALTGNPAFMKLLDNPRVRQIEQKMQLKETR